MPRDLDLGAAGEALGGDRFHGAVRGTGRRTQRRELAGGLHAAERAHRGSCLDDLGRIERRRQAKRESRPHLVLDGNAQGRADDALDDPDRILRLPPGNELEVVGQFAELVARERLLQSRHDEGRLAIRRNHEAGEPLHRRCAVPQQILVVRRGRDEQRVDAPLAGGRGSPPDAIPMLGGG